MSTTSLKVLSILADGQSFSGEAIGNALGLSRMAISKAIKKLKHSGLKINTVRGKGYRLECPLQLLDKNEINAALSGAGSSNIEIEIFQQIESTSDYLLQKSVQKELHHSVCIAESQSGGRGRRQRKWHATPYQNIMLSIGCNFDGGMAGLSGLGIAAGITIARALHEAGFDNDIGLKWPNDIVWKDKKLGGLLIDVRGETDGPCFAVLGLGLNLVLSDEDRQSIDQPCVSLAQISGNNIDRNALVIHLIKELRVLFDGYNPSDFKTFHQLWPGYDRLLGREVNVTRGSASFSGHAMGIDEIGALLLDDGEKTFRKFMSGDVSLRLAP